MARWSHAALGACLLAFGAANPGHAQALADILRGRWTTDEGGDCRVHSSTLALAGGVLRLTDGQGKVDTQRVTEQRPDGIATVTVTSTHGIRVGMPWVYEVLAPGQVSLTKGDTGESTTLRHCQDPIPATATPEQFLRRIYASYAASDEANLPLTSPATIQAFFTPELADKLIAYASRTGHVDTVCISEDPFIAGQDYKVSDVRVRMEPATTDHAKGTVSFRNVGKPITVRFDLQHTAAGWRIADLFPQDGHSFRAQLVPCVG